MVMMPCAAARWQISATGKVIAVGEVMWLTMMARVRGVTPCQSCSMTSAALARGSVIGWLRYCAPFP